MDANEPRIVLDPAILDGKPVVRGTRLSVEHIIGLMAEGWGEAEILADYPGLAHEDRAACLAYARDLLNNAKRRLPGEAEIRRWAAEDQDDWGAVGETQAHSD